MMIIPPAVQSILPELIVGGGALLTLLHDLFSPRNQHKVIAALGCFFIALAALAHFGFGVGSGTHGEAAFGGGYLATPWSFTLKAIILSIAFLGCAISGDYLQRQRAHYNESYVLIQFAALGAMFMVSSSNTIVILLGVEIVSVVGYILVGMPRFSPHSTEAALKYFFNGALGTALLLLGLAFLYGSSGSMDIFITFEAVEQGRALSTFFAMGLVITLIALAIKAGLVPFHMWVPDAYSGAVLPVTLLLFLLPKVAFFGVIVHLTNWLLQPQNLALFNADATGSTLINALLVIALGSITLGNVAALLQTHLKRLFAYASIAGSGYLLLALLFAPNGGLQAFILYFVAYALAISGVFMVLLLLRKQQEQELTLPDLNGLIWRHPWLGFALILCLLSLAGMPLTPGFLAKFSLFSAGVAGEMYIATTIGLLNSALAIVYYLKILCALFLRQTFHLQLVGSQWVLFGTLSIVVLASVLFGSVFAAHFMQWADTGALLMLR